MATGAEQSWYRPTLRSPWGGCRLKTAPGPWHRRLSQRLALLSGRPASSAMAATDASAVPSGPIRDATAAATCSVLSVLPGNCWARLTTLHIGSCSKAAPKRWRNSVRAVSTVLVPAPGRESTQELLPSLSPDQHERTTPRDSRYLHSRKHAPAYEVMQR